MKVLVTGGAGFIGANLCQRLALDPAIDRVVAYDNLSTGDLANLDGCSDVRVVVADICDPAALAEAMHGAQAVVHLAALPSVPRSIEDPVASHVSNTTGTLEVLEAARRAGDVHVVVASSSSVYGSSPELPKHERLKPSPVSPYAATKLAAETYTLAWGATFDMRVLAFRFFNVFGPLQPAGHAYAAVLPAFISAAIEGRALPIHGDGEQSRDFTYVGSACEVIHDALRRGVTHPEPVNLAFGSRTTLLEVVEILESIFERSLEREHLPPRLGDVRHSMADQTRLRSLFPGLSPLSLEQGIRATVDWFATLPRPGI